MATTSPQTTNTATSGI